MSLGGTNEAGTAETVRLHDLLFVAVKKRAGLGEALACSEKLCSNPERQACTILPRHRYAETAPNMSNSPTLPPAPGPHRTLTPSPGLANESDARLQAALAASARAEASLHGLSRAIEHLGNGVGGARDANESLTLELEALRDMLGVANDQQSTFSQKIAQLELALDRARKEFAHERAFLIDQQDTFLVKLLDEQEAELKRRDVDLDTLRGRLAELERRDLVTMPPPLVSLPSLEPAKVQLLEHTQPLEGAGSALDRAERAELERSVQKLAEDRERARETVARLQAQRDEAQSAVVRISKERDDALQLIHRLKSELGGPRIPLSSRPPAAESRRDSSRSLISSAALTLDQLEMEARLNRPTAPSPASSPSASSQISSSPARAHAISSVLSPPRSNPNASPIPSRLSPPPARLSPIPARHSPPPEELRRAITSPPSMQSAASSRPPLKQKPDASTRPLVGYSLSTESIEAEELEGVRLSSKPPGSNKR